MASLPRALFIGIVPRRSRPLKTTPAAALRRQTASPGAAWTWKVRNRGHITTVAP